MMNLKFWKLCVLMVLILMLKLPLFASGFDERKCISDMKLFGEPNKSCAEEVCAWQACVERVQTTKTKVGYKVKDTGASGSAIATCKSSEVVMKVCQDRHQPAAKIDDLCKDKHYEAGTASSILKALNTTKGRKSSLAKRGKVIGSEIKKIDARKSKLYAFLKSEKAAMDVDRKLPKEEKIRKWKNTGRYAKFKAQQGVFGELTAKRKKLFAEYKSGKADFDRLKEVLAKAGKAYNNRECGKAISGLALDIKPMY